LPGGAPYINGSAVVDFETSTGVLSYKGRTDESGLIEIPKRFVEGSDLKPRTIRVFVSEIRGQSELFGVLNWTPGSASSRSVRLAEQPMVLRGFVRTGGGTAVHRAELYLRLDGRRDPIRVSTERDGSFSIRAEPGWRPLTLEVRKEGYRRESIELGTWSSELEVQLTALSSITAELGISETSAKYYAYSAQATSAGTYGDHSGTVLADGRVNWRLPSGRYDLRVSLGGVPVWTAVGVAAKEGEELEIRGRVLTSVATLSVVDERGEPVSGVTVSVRDGSVNWVRGWVCDDAGSVELDLPTEGLELQLTKAGFESKTVKLPEEGYRAALIRR
jgi:hypothetical protein